MVLFDGDFHVVRCRVILVKYCIYGTTCEDLRI
jgi:hypothetical protein